MTTPGPAATLDEDGLLALPGGLLLVVAGNVLVTGFAGAVFCALRLGGVQEGRTERIRLRHGDRPASAN